MRVQNVYQNFLWLLHSECEDLLNNFHLNSIKSKHAIYSIVPSL